jgi:predicted transcriptional regulator
MLWEYRVGMTTVTVQLDEKLLEKARGIAAARHASVDEVLADALQRMDSEEDRAAGFLALMEELRAKGVGPLPRMTREERKERR